MRVTCSNSKSGPIPGPDGTLLEPRCIIWAKVQQMKYAMA